MSDRSWAARGLVASLCVWSALACTGTTTVVGERAGELGGCPSGEVCAASVPAGLWFQGQMLYDDGEPRLGPVLAGGRFDLSFFPVTGVMTEFDVVIEGGSLDVAGTEIGVGQPSGAELWGLESGYAVVRIVSKETGELFDRLTLETVELDGIELTNINDPTRTHLLGGCDEMIGVRLMAEGGTLRAFDQNITVEAEGFIEPDPMVWDCFRYSVPEDTEEVTIVVTAAGETYEETFVVQQGENCPEQTSD
jgi:hypothetical protein